MKPLYKLLLFTLSLAFLQSAMGQETAMDFTQDDCAGTSHQLFQQLDAGKVVIVEFVMLNCAPCIVGTNALESIIKPYETSHPGRVHIYSFGFLNSYTCEQLTAWRNDNEFTHPVFNNGEEQVDYYGGMGMPTIVVTGTNEHKVFFKSIGYLPSMDDDIKAAIDSALLYNPTGIGDSQAEEHFTIYPTIFSGHLNVKTIPEFAGSTLTITNAAGTTVYSGLVSVDGSLVISSLALPKGIYFARLFAPGRVSGTVKLVRQ